MKKRKWRPKIIDLYGKNAFEKLGKQRPSEGQVEASKSRNPQSLQVLVGLQAEIRFLGPSLRLGWGNAALLLGSPATQVVLRGTVAVMEIWEMSSSI